MSKIESQVKKISDSYLNTIESAFAIYLDTFDGFQRNQEKVARAQHQKLKSKGINEITDEHLAELDDNDFIVWGDNDLDKDPLIYHAVLQGKYLERNSPDGLNALMMGRYFLILVYSFWEEHYRQLFADSIGVSDKNDVHINIMGDMRRLRHDIVHHNAIATKGWSGKASILNWFSDGDVIIINKERVVSIVQEIVSGVDSFVYSHTDKHFYKDLRTPNGYRALI